MHVVYALLSVIIFAVSLVVFTVLTVEFLTDFFDNASKDVIQLWKKRLRIGTGVILLLFFIGFVLVEVYKKGL